MPSPYDALARFAGWYRTEALPFWAGAAWDSVRGGFYEAIGHDGAPVDPGPRRVRVQARQIYAFAEAARLGWLPAGEALAMQGFEHFLARACPGGGSRGCVHVLDRGGEILDSRRDLYDQAFLLLACAAVWRLAREPRALALASACLDFLDAELAHPHGGWREDDRGALPRRQNPHMHMFEALMALAEATGEDDYLDRASRVHALFEARFFDPAAGVVREFFADDWTLAAGEAGAAIEPGHMAEWSFLLARYAGLGGGGGALEERARLLLSNAHRLGADDQGFLVDRVLVGARPGGARRLWPQTEYLRAHIVAARGGEAASAEAAVAFAARLLGSYLAHPVPGLWHDRCDASGAPIAPDVPASILYHLHGPAVEAAALLEGKMQ